MPNVKVPKNRFEDLLKVRDSGLSNMNDREGVVLAANKLQLYSLVIFLYDLPPPSYRSVLEQFDRWLRYRKGTRNERERLPR